MSRGQVAAKVRENKDLHPEQYCSAKGCLWVMRSGTCPKHPHAPIHRGRIVAGEDEEFALPEVKA